MRDKAYSVIMKALIILAAFILSGTVFEYVAFFGVKPNIVLAAALAVSFFSGPVEAGIWGALAGMLVDFMWGRVFGIHTLLCLYSVLFTKAVQEIMFRRSVLIVSSLTALCEFFYEFIFFFLNFIIWSEKRIAFSLIRIILPAVIYTGLVQTIVYPIVKAAFDRRAESEMRL